VKPPHVELAESLGWTGVYLCSCCEQYRGIDPADSADWPVPSISWETVGPLIASHKISIRWGWQDGEGVAISCKGPLSGMSWPLLSAVEHLLLHKEV